MRRVVTVISTSGAAADVSLDVPAEACVADVTTDLDRIVPGGVAGLSRGRRTLDPRTPLRDLGDGDVLTVGTAGSSPLEGATEPLVTVEVVAGRDAGRRVALPAGRHCLGRDGVLRISDAKVSRRHVEVVVSVEGAVAVTDLESANGTLCGERELEPGAPQEWAPGVLLRLGSTLLVHGREASRAALLMRADGSYVVNPPPRLLESTVPTRVHFPAPAPVVTTPARLPLLTSLAPLAAGLVLAFVLRRWEFAVFALMSPLVVLGQAASDRWAARRTNRASAAAHARAVDLARAELRAALAAEAAARQDAAPDLARIVTAAAGRSDLLWHRRPSDHDGLCLRVGLGAVPPQTLVEGGPPPAALPDAPVVLDLDVTPAVGVSVDEQVGLGVLRSLLVQLAVLHGPSSLRIVLLVPGRGQIWAWARWLPHVRAAGSSTTIGMTRSQVRARLDELAEHHDDRHTVVVVDGIDDSAVADVLVARERTSVLWMCRSPVPPAACTAVVEPGPDGALRLRRAAFDDVVVAPDLVDLETAELVSRALAPLRDVASEAVSLPTSVRWSGLQGFELADPEAAAAALVRRWRAGPATRVRLGVGSDGPVDIDLRVDGPHMLVAGTTGAGKSELLQSLVASLVAGNSPDQLALLLVDFKGGAAFGPCARLPHTLGVLTDLDAASTTRALASLSAELRRRERVLAQAGVADVDALAATSRSISQVPRLVIIVDEFATLAEELPDFVGGLVGVAQRGRSLGVHLVLATQRPEGAVSADIRANARLRVCLAVARETESTDVLDSPRAATISRLTPGRAFVRAGAHELREVQTARVAGPWVPPGPRVAVVPLPAWGEPAATPAGPAACTELDLLVTAATDAAALSGASRTATPWLPPLPCSLALGRVPPASRDHVAVGLVDLPHEQRQPPLELPIGSCDPLLVVGVPRSGRTTTALTVVTSLAAQLSPDDLHVYAIDSGRGLSPLAELPHTGAVVDARDPGRVERLLGYLVAEAERRRDGATPGGPDPQLLLVVDSWDGVVAATGDADAGRSQDLLLRLAAGGASGRLRLVVTCDRTGLSGRLGTSIADKLCLRLTDRGDYALLGLPTRQAPADVPPGRALRTPDLAWAQLAVTDDAARAAARRWPAPARAPRRFDPLPQRIPLHTVTRSSGVVVGVRGDDLAPLVLDPRDTGVLLVAGPPGSGRSTTLVSVAAQLRDRAVVSICPRRGPLRQRRDLATAGDPAAALAAFGEGAALLVDDVDLLDEPGVLDGLEAAVRQARDGGGFVVLAGATEAMSAAFRGPVAQARRSRTGLLLRPEGPHDGELLGVRLRRRAAHADPPGRGILALHGTAVAVQVPDPG